MSAGEPGPPADPPGQTLAATTSPTAFREAALGYIDPSAIKPHKVVVDGGNGMAGQMVGPLLDSLPIEQERTYWEPDGTFPDHEPNPLLEENRRFIIERVRETGADLGIAWDGDADRCFFIDDTGEFVAGDFLTALLAQSILRKEPGATILYDVRASRAVATIWSRRAGGTAKVNRVGHAFFKTRMRDTGAAFGGEVSGHYYFRDFYCADSGTLPALLLLELLSVEGAGSASCSSRFAPSTSSPARSTPRSRTRTGRWTRSPSATRTARSAGWTASRSTTRTGTSTCGPRTPSRCCGSTWSR